MRSIVFKLSFLPVFLFSVLVSCCFIPSAEADWEDWVDDAVSMALKKAAPILLDGIQNWLFDTPMGELLEKAANGDAEAQFALGLMFYTGDHVEKNTEEAIEWWRMSAENGYAKAQFTVGVAYYKGDGVAQDKEEGIKWLRAAAKHGQRDAQNLLKEIKIKY